MITGRGGVVASALVCSSFVFGGTNPRYEDAASAYAGWYVGVGIGYQYTKSDVVLSDNMDRYMAVAGGGLVGPAIGGVHDLSLSRTNVGRASAVLSVGYGDFITGSCYLGGEANLDIAGSKKSKSGPIVAILADGNPADYMSTEVKTRGLVPTLAVRLGGYIPVLDGLFYARVGLTFLNNKFASEWLEDQGFGSQKVTSILGLGFEKKISDSCSMKVEGDYRFPADKTKNNLKNYVLEANSPGVYGATVKNKVRSYVVRVVCVYHF